MGRGKYGYRSPAPALKWIITTAGFNRAGVCYEQRDYVTKILDGVIEDDRYFGIVYTVDDGDDWSDERSHRKANPNYGVSVLPEDISTLCRQAQLSAQSQNNFLTKRLNIWVSADTAFYNMQAWDRCRRDIKIEDFHGQPCWMGLDLAAKHDLTAKMLLFERDDEWYVFGQYYLPEDEIEQGINSNAAHYAGWARAGRMILTPGNITDYEWLGAISSPTRSDSTLRRLFSTARNDVSAFAAAGGRRHRTCRVSGEYRELLGPDEGIGRA